MYEVWNSLKRGLNCKTLPDVLEAKDCKININRNNHPNSWGSRSTQNLHGSKQHVQKSTVGKSHGSSTVVSQKCDDSMEKHNLSKHTVSELVDGEESRKVVEIICRTSNSKSEENSVGIEKVLKFHNIPKTLTEFEEYREIVKVRWSKLSETHPRCLADGNELLRFYGTTVACSIGMNGSSSLCTFYKCGVCQILRHGFSIKKENHGGEMGVFTTSTCERAMECIELEEINKSIRKAVILCRVIAGRIHNNLEMLQYREGNESGFDTLAGELDRSCNFEELYLLNPKSLLPCFVVISK